MDARRWGCWMAMAAWLLFAGVCSALDIPDAGTDSDPPLRVLEALLEDGDEGKISLVIVLERPVRPIVFALDEPVRVVVDIPRATADDDLPSELLPRSEHWLRRVRVGDHPEEGFVRFVCDLAEGKEYTVTPRLEVSQKEGGPVRLEVLLEEAEGAP